MATPLRSSPVLIMSFVGSCGAAAVWPSGAPGRGHRAWWHRIVADARAGAGRSADDQHVPRKPRQELEAAGPGVEPDEVLDPDARLTFEVDPRFDAEDRRRRQRRVGRGPAQRGALVSGQPDAMAQPVAV